VYNGLLYLMKRQVNSYIVLQDNGFPHLHLDLINSFLCSAPYDDLIVSLRITGRKCCNETPDVNENTFEHTGLWDRGDMHLVHYRHGDIVV
jgi:hypothetical protein